MNLIHLRYFVELSRTGSYTQAAKRLCITQPSLSHAMAQLEEELGAPLFRRQGRTTALTPLGEQFLTAVRQSLDVLDRGIEEVRQAAGGRDCCASAWSAPWRWSWCQSWPGPF